MATKLEYRKPISDLLDESEMHKILIKPTSTYRQLKLGYLLAIEMDDMETMLKFIEKGVTPRGDRNYDLVIALRNERMDIARWLVNQGGNVNCRDFRPLREACEMDCRQTLAFLIEQGVDVTVKNNFAIARTARYGYFEMSLVLLDNGASLSLLSSNMKNKLYTRPEQKLRALTKSHSPDLIEGLVEYHCKKKSTNTGAAFADAPQWLKPYYMKHLF